MYIYFNQFLDILRFKLTIKDDKSTERLFLSASLKLFFYYFFEVSCGLLSKKMNKNGSETISKLPKLMIKICT